MSAQRTRYWRVRRVGVAGCLVALAACSTTVPGTAVPGGALLTVDRDVDLGVAYLGGGGRVGPVVLDSTDTPVVLSTTEFAGQAGLTRGTDLSTSVPIAALGENGLVSAMAIAPDDTVVLVGDAGDDVTPSIIRVAPDGTEQVLPLVLPDVIDPIAASSSQGGAGSAFASDASLVVLTDVPIDYSSGVPIELGVLQVAVVDTSTGTAVEVIEAQLSDPAGAIPGEEASIRVEDVVMTADGGVVLAVAIADVGTQLLRLDSSLDPMGGGVAYPRPDSEYGTHLAVDEEGTAYLTSDVDGVELLRFPVGATEPEVVATLADTSSGVSGLAVDPSGTWAYVTGLTDIDLGQTVVAVDLATGTITSPTGLCRQGFSEAPVLGSSGAVLLVPAECSDVTTNQEHLYLLGD